MSLSARSRRATTKPASASRSLREIRHFPYRKYLSCCLDDPPPPKRIRLGGWLIPDNMEGWKADKQPLVHNPRHLHHAGRPPSVDQPSAHAVASPARRDSAGVRGGRAR